MSEATVRFDLGYFWVQGPPDEEFTFESFNLDEYFAV